MNCTNLKAKFVTRRCFARSRLEAEYLAKSYEIIMPIYKRECLRARNQHRDEIEKVIAAYPREMGA